jgi:hypothetical protein
VDPSTLTFAQLADLRRRTDAVARFLREQLAQHLETLRPLLAAQRVLGISPGSRIAWTNQTLSEFKQRYAEHHRPFRLPTDLDPESIAEVTDRIEVHPWEYVHETREASEAKPITMTSPTRWVANYAGDVNLTRIRAILAGQESGQWNLVQQFVLRALVLDLVISKSPRVVDLLRALRFEVERTPAPEFHNLPLTTIRFVLPSFRPPDQLILDATAFSGVPAFIELIDVDAMPTLTDPVKARLEELVK